MAQVPLSVLDTVNILFKRLARVEKCGCHQLQVLVGTSAPTGSASFSREIIMHVIASLASSDTELAMCHLPCLHHKMHFVCNVKRAISIRANMAALLTKSDVSIHCFEGQRCIRQSQI